MTSDATAPERLASAQRAFAAHIRDPESAAAPAGVEDRRMQVYRRLFFNNILNLLSGNFPVLRKLYSDGDWRHLARQFYAEHRAQTPLFPELPREFLRYLQEQRAGRAGDPPFLLELAHYEWVELALAQDQLDLEQVSADPRGNLLDHSPYLSPLAWPLTYQFPVHRISRSFRPTEAPPEPTHLLVYRSRDDVVRFMQLNAPTRLLLDLMRTRPEWTGRQLLQHMAGQIAHPDPEALLAFGQALFEDLRQRDVILGTCNRPETETP